MKYRSNSPSVRCWFSRHGRSHAKSALQVVIGIWLLAGRQAGADNLLVNPGFEQDSGHVVPFGWTRFAPPTAQSFGNYWIEGNVPPHSGSFYFKEWGAAYNGTNNVAGIYQDLSTAPGFTYDASGWFYTSSSDLLGVDCQLWLEVAFLGSSSNLLALYKSDNFSSTVGVNSWLQYTVANACDISVPLSVGDPYYTTYAVTGTVSRLVAPPGATKVRYRFAYLQSGSEGGSAFFDDAVLNQASGSVPPVISNLFPLNMIFVNPGDGITFNASSPSGNTINSSGIHLVVNGMDVSSSLQISGSSSNRTVTYLGLQSNLTYTASIMVVDSANLSASATTYFETTWVGVPPVVDLWEAEDFDFTNGMFINFPTLCNVSGVPTCYFGKVGLEGFDEHSSGTVPNHMFRPDDAIGTVPSGDFARKDHYLAGVQDYRIDPFNGGDWLNYTRDWPAGSYWVVGRLSTDILKNGTLTLSVVNPDTTTTDLGTFSIASGLGWSTFENVFLKDTNGNNAVVTLNGKTTLRVTSGGNLLPNFFMLVAGQVDLPTLSNVFPTGAHPFEYTNSLSLTITTIGATFPANGITVNLDGIDVTNLVITGPASVKNVLCAGVLPNAIHQAIIAATNSLGHGIRVTNQFDTFSEANYMVEAEDFDYDAGQYVDPWTPDSYQTLGATTNVDFQHISLAGEQFVYRPEGIPTDRLGQHDWLRSNFQYFVAIDYVLTFFAGSDWANYTRVYPSGSFYVYGRFSGGGPFSMYLDKVVSGTGTTNQVTRRLGQWSAVGKDYVTYQWVPLTDSGLAPTVVNLDGPTTLRITTDGFCNPNFFMLVPATGIPLTAGASGTNFSLSFPTQAGATYRVFYRTDLTSGNWILLTSFLGDGSVKSVSDVVTGTRRFYKVVAP